MILRFRTTWRERMPEWLLALWIALWGSIVVRSPGLFDPIQHPFYGPLAKFLPQAVWGWSALVVGLARVAFLVINGSWRPSADLRWIGCLLSCAVLIGLFVGAIMVDWRSPAIATYGALLALDVWNMWFAGRDAARYARLSEREGVRADGTA